MNKYSVLNPLVLQVLMQVLYLIILWSINETNLDEKETELNHSQQTTLQLAYRDLSLSRKHEST